MNAPRCNACQTEAVAATPQESHPENNFDFIRVVAACLVILGHSFVAFDQDVPTYWGTPVHNLGIEIFFVISGYLVYGSFLRDPRPFPYLIKRALRILPALAVCVLVTVCVLGPCVTSLHVADYFHQSGTYSYLTNAVLMFQLWLPGVFDANPAAGAVNGSLWSLPVEAFCYVLVVLVVARFGSVVLAAVFAAAAVYFNRLSGTQHPYLFSLDLALASRVAFFFAAGAVLRRYQNALAWRLDVALLLTFVLPLAGSIPGTGVPLVTRWLLLPYIVIALGRARTPVVSAVGRIGDPSYGMYLYGFPLQQTAVHLGFSPRPVLLATFACLSAGALGLASWHLVERHALRLKPGRRSIA